MSFAPVNGMIPTDVLFSRRYGILETARVNFKERNAAEIENASGTAVQAFSVTDPLAMDLLIGDIEISQKALTAKHPVLISATSLLRPGLHEVGAVNYETAARSFFLSHIVPSHLPEGEDVKVHFVIEQADGSIGSYAAPEMFNELRAPDISGQGKVELHVGARESSGAATIVAQVLTEDGVAFFRSDSTDLRSALQALAPFVEENAERELRSIKSLRNYLYSEY